MTVPNGIHNSDDPPSDRRAQLRTRMGVVLRHDLPASIVVFLVALPLSIGIAIASGAPIMAGLIAAVVGGVVAGAVGGSPLLASGPAAGLTVIVAELISRFGLGVTCAITVAAGVLQILFGLSRVARAALAISPIVVHAMLAGIGLTIALQQVHVLQGGDAQSTVWRNLVELPGAVWSAHLDDLAVGLTVIVLMLLWPRLPGPVRRIPAALGAVVLATALSLLLPGVDRVVMDGSILEAITLPTLPDGQWAAVATGVITVALVASVESLLSAVAVDKMHGGAKTDLNRELVGQGAANVTSGMLGGLPITGVIVRSATNVQAGARTRASTIMHGLWVLLFSVLLASVIALIPRSALAGLLIVIGIQLVKLAHIRLAHRTGDLWVYGVTVAGVLFLNLLEGVLIGLALATVRVLWRVVHANVHAEQVGTPQDEHWRLSIDGSCTFLSLPRLSKVLASIPAGAEVSVEANVDFMDHAAGEMVDDWVQRHRDGGGTVIIDEHGSTALETARVAPPRRISLRALSHGSAPWKSWQQSAGVADTDADASALRPVLDGVHRYHRRHVPQLREHLADLRYGQRPDSLFLTCADSRIVPNIITSSGPGDLFTVRNVGNLVPQDDHDVSVEAAIAYAIEELEVTSLIVCGHSGCGAMGALLAGADEDPDAAPAIRNWLQHAAASKQAFAEDHPIARAARDGDFDERDQLGLVNVAVQVQHLREHSLVAAAGGRVAVAGLFLDIGSARVLRVDDARIVTDDELWLDNPVESEPDRPTAGSGPSGPTGTGGR